jgi:hypothetical protein
MLHADRCPYVCVREQQADTSMLKAKVR